MQKFSKSGCALALAGLALAVALFPVLIGAQDQAPNESGAIIDFLNQTILWYRQLGAQQQVAAQPSDSVEFGQDRQLADQIARLSFDFARARAQSLPGAAFPEPQPDESAANSPDLSRYQGLTAVAAKADAEVKAQQKLITSLKLQSAAASGRKRAALDVRISDEVSELALMQARADSLHNFISFAAGAKAQGNRSGSLQSQIEELARALPEVALQGSAAANVAPAAANAPVNPPAQARPSGNGLFSLASNVFSLRKKARTLDEGLQLTDALATASQQLRQPLVSDLRSLTQQGSQLTSQPDSPDPKVVEQHRNAVQALTALYKQLASTVLPLAKQALLLSLYRRNLSSWDEAAHNEASSALKSFIFRLVILAVILGVVLSLAELWRRAILHYVHDKRRRFQFLFMRRIVVWALVAFIIALAFASEIGSLATFAGLLTAGIAVALQNVIISLVGYFFLIGKFGVRVGDRVQVAGVTGYIIDIGLLRLRMMETGGFGAGNRPTGRVVTFPNAVVFQASAGLFKQAPGTKFVWHEIKVSLAAGCDYQAAEKRLLDAVNTVFEEYKESIDQQHGHMVSEVAPLMVDAPAPEARLYITDNGLAVTLRYPVDVDGATAIDARVTRAILEAAAHEPRLRIAGLKPEAQPA